MISGELKKYMAHSIQEEPCMYREVGCFSINVSEQPSFQVRLVFLSFQQD